MLLISVAMASTAVISTPPSGTTATDASPAATAAPVEEPVVSGDPRSDGEGPGIVGSPLVILLGVVFLGLLTAVVTILVVRLRGQR